MSRFVETLVIPKMDPSVEIEKHDDEEKKQEKTMGGDEKHEENTILKPDDELDSSSNFCLIAQPDKDKESKVTPKKKKITLERLTIPVREDAADIRREQDVQMVGISILCPGRPEIVLSQPFISSPKAYLFTLKEGTKYRLNFSFIVSNRCVSALKYENTLWKAGIRVDKSTVMLGTYGPREKPYVFQLEEDTLPSGILVRGLYCARTKVTDSEGKCYMDIQYYFNISKTWPSVS